MAESRWISRFFRGRWLRYSIIVISCLMLLSPFLFLPQLVGNDDLCGGLCIRRFYLIFPGMGWDDFVSQVKVAAIGVGALVMILTVTFFFGRLWCGYLCPMGGFPELVSRIFHDRWKIDYRVLPQVPIRYGYFITYLVVMPALGFSACTLCNFITIPRMFEAFVGDARGIVYLISTVGAVNLALVILLGFFAKLGRGYCQFLCPVGAIDGIVNRIGAKLSFVQRIRVERSRCTGCRDCAEVCISGAIRMEDRIAEVGQLSCLACRECVIACEWGAIDWVTLPPQKMPARLKKGIEVAPPPVWSAVAPKGEGKERRKIRWPRILVAVLFGFGLMMAIVTDVIGAQRQSDPDGCLACHALPGLAYADKDGVIRDSTLSSDHYAASIHGSVPCTDCHRKIKAFPHRPENGEVDCAAACHLEEPSKGEAYTHKPIAEEFLASVHGQGQTKGFTGANRIDEDRNDAPPSCRRCHANTLYIPEEKMALFQEAFNHEEQACGNCHQGKVWRGQMGGHILRRLVGERWTKQEEVKVCNGCHQDREAMERVERQTTSDGKKKAADAHFVLASDSYEMGLHGRLVAVNSENGTSCSECHAPSGSRHGILPAENKASAVHTDNLKQTCTAAGCHGYAAHPLNSGFLHTDMHDLDIVPAYSDLNPLKPGRFDSNWTRTLAILTPPVALFFVAGMLWSLFDWKKRDARPILGGTLFERHMLKKKPKKKKAGKKKLSVSGGSRPVRDKTWFKRMRRSKKRAFFKQEQERLKQASRQDSKTESANGEGDEISSDVSPGKDS
ncbi:MAG: 4Fe-4S binding protein [gamma proteobacterium endosymbiont of Lamellibrachia anaximandri]|nr:4Fe-4S binding protein [gamma proteobacterium endosymbiont of Lamellibrachia anaximandri]MBL3534616.1 4Fe-4S binding protein [gamma proteobacterium endosymbiont of Lamellibrachia anaximandri]